MEVYQIARSGNGSPERLGLDVEAFGLAGIPRPLLVEAIQSQGGTIVEVDILSEARQFIGSSELRYRLGAQPVAAPKVVDCSSFTRWLFGKKGIFLPRRTIQQVRCGEVVDQRQIRPLDLIFRTGRVKWYEADPAGHVGHVGIASGANRVIHATNCGINGLIEVTLQDFLAGEEFRDVRRIIPEGHQVITAEFPAGLIDSSDDLLWIARRLKGKS